jgi:putative phosphoribosyl transferase
MGESRRFADRADAGRRLVELLPALEDEPVVLGLARGGVPVAAEVADALGAPLDVLVVRKVGHPAQPEYALGAVSEDGVALPEGLPPELVEPQLEEARAQAQRLRAGRERLSLEGRTAIVVDDGLATGRSMTAAIEGVARRGARRAIMAVPVASGPGMRALADRCEAHAALVVEPPEFFAVGQFYVDFSQVSDEEVAALLQDSTGPTNVERK